TAACIGLLKRAEGGRLAQLDRAVSRACRSSRGKLWGIGLLCVLLAGLIPMPEIIHCRCEIQPVSRRFVAAPFEASLEQSLVRAGDVVSAGDVLARLDGRELRMKLAGVQAEIQQAAKKQDAQLAERQLAEARLTGLELNEAELERELYQHRLSQLDIRSPVDGVVISGDLERAEGVRLSLGQTLFEIAPVDRMIAELEITQPDISNVKQGMPVEIDLEADDGRRRKGTVTRIQPQSVRKDQQYVFPAEIELENTSRTLRPGMRGRGRLTGEWKPLGWILFRRPWHQFLFMIGW
ncbi:MAG: efflux RND transporter periplasmic adaptor subunit, partial [Planctomycetaceae bacterium]|nr:efflux RND transporter periplasmic adaptor subunit [Planctomycetaceae bacterium]